MKLVVGLGNPGKAYEKTRHNAGFIAVDLLLEKYGYSSTKEEFDSQLFLSEVNGEKVYFMKPQTYMNSSGVAIRKFLDFYKLDVSEIIVLYDDKDFPVGKQQFKFRGSGSGHNGIKSIIQNLKTENFNRIRIGIGARPEK
jgi:PTH1 family peptidyl-tRNA hydrolase